MTKRRPESDPTRPDYDELGGMSESRLREAGRQRRKVAGTVDEEEGDVVPEGGPPRRRDLASAPEDLGRRALEEGAQDTGPEEEAERLPREEETPPGEGERRTREQAAPETSPDEDRLVSHIPQKSERFRRERRQPDPSPRRPTRERDEGEERRT